MRKHKYDWKAIQNQNQPKQLWDNVLFFKFDPILQKRIQFNLAGSFINIWRFMVYGFFLVLLKPKVSMTDLKGAFLPALPF